MLKDCCQHECYMQLVWIGTCIIITTCTSIQYVYIQSYIYIYIYTDMHTDMHTYISAWVRNSINMNYLLTRNIWQTLTVNDKRRTITNHRTWLQQNFIHSYWFPGNFPVNQLVEALLAIATHWLHNHWWACRMIHWQVVTGRPGPSNCPPRLAGTHQSSCLSGRGDARQFPAVPSFSPSPWCPRDSRSKTCLRMFDGCWGRITRIRLHQACHRDRKWCFGGPGENHADRINTAPC